MMRSSAPKYAVHGLRVVLLACSVLLMRWQQTKLLASSAALGQSLPSLKDVRTLFGEAASMQPGSNGQLLVRGSDGEALGYAMQTSPMCDHILGFSGPTNTLIALSSDDLILGVHVLSSKDTRDHVRQVLEDEQFMTSLNSLSLGEAKTASYDAVSGATLTSLAIRESIALRLGGRTKTSLKFPNPPAIDAVRVLFTKAASIEATDSAGLFDVLDRNNSQLGSLLRTSPAADNIIGFQGPTEALIGFGLDAQVLGVTVGQSFDNEPYVGYAREDAYFRKIFNGRDIGSLATVDLMESQVEGVSGATMTSMAVAEGVVLASQRRQEQIEAAARKQPTESFFSRWSIHDFGTALCLAIGSVVGLTKLRGNRKLATVWQIVLVGYLGLVAGSLLSQAMFVGWARNGIPTKSSFGLLLLAIGALCVPIVTRRNLYCSHLCPHGAAQQLLKNRLPWKVKLTARVRNLLRLIPALLLIWCVVVGIGGLSFSLVDIEPFDAWVFRIAGWATITVAVVGLVASLFVPMAYCRFGCPTGAMLEFLRFNSKADSWTTRDWVATLILVIAGAMCVL